MKPIPTKTLQDLEFDTILQSIALKCVTEPGRAQVLTIQPYTNQEALLDSLQQTNEYLASFSNQNALPNHGFDDLSKDFQFLAIDNSHLDAPVFLKIKELCETTIKLARFLQKMEVYYPNLLASSLHLNTTLPVAAWIDAIVDAFGEVKNNASVDLEHIRYQMGLIKGKINQSFGTALSHYNSLGYLDEIRESVVDNKRVLAVLSMYRKKVKGSILGTSKTGSISYVEPESTNQFTRELQNLQWEEKEEIEKILKKLSAQIRPFINDLVAYQTFLTHIDVVAAKAKYARQIHAILPEINQEKRLYFRDAYHPILWLTNQAKKQKTYPQTIALENDKRIIVISGPNAGGKTISLKTVGLLQLMLQSGILIPVHERSTTCLFDRILTDIGDNQSIENHLSTYSYRLKNMNYFLKKCSSNTLFLIDEFGTGSDPELGGALAETFLEEFYHREAYGIITTHYTNLKILANELPFAINANMLFDERSLEPMFQLHLGQPGSSFTFEVAQKNGIPYGLINRAKKKIEHSKVRFDKTIATLQKERAKLEKTSTNLKEEEQKAREESTKMKEINDKIKDKLIKYQELYDQNQRLVYLGQKLDDLSLNYLNNANKKVLIGELLKVVEMENAKRKKASAKEIAIQKKEQQVLQKEVAPKLEEIRKEKKAKKIKEQKLEAEKPVYVPKVGDRVRMIDGKAVGSIDSIEKNKAVVNYGVFTSKVSLEMLELVEKGK
jgi:DNA mismatch repair protein MutS2